MKKFAFAVATTGMVACACLFARIPVASASAVLQANLPGVAVEGSELLIALPIQNIGDTPTLPVQLVTIAPDNASVLNMRFNVRALRQSFQLEIQGRVADDQTGRDHEFHIHTVIQVPPAAPGSATIGNNNGTTNTTKGPYPALPQPPQTEDNEFRAPTPLGSPQLIYNPTPTGTPAQAPGGAGASVGFVFNTQSGGIANRFPPDPSAVGSGSSSNVVLATGNLYIKYSTDGGSTFTTISDLSTVFGDSPDGGYCCDQVVH
jgi:hypothetical protein